MTTRLTVADLRAAKGQTQYTDVYVSSEDEAAAAAAGGIDILTIQDSQMSPAMRAAAEDTFVVVGLDYGEVVTTDDYLRAAFAAIGDGADACWCAASLHTIERLAAEGVPIVGHVGLIPPRRTWTGGFKAVGKTAGSAMEVWRQTVSLANAAHSLRRSRWSPNPLRPPSARRRRW